MKFQTPVKQEHTGGGCKRPHPTSDEVLTCIHVWVNLCVATLVL